MVDLHCEAHKFNLLPAGLNELMSDISREVLRAQPEDIPGFIAGYLRALLDARKAMVIAGDVVQDVRDSCTCEAEELRVKEGSSDESKTSVILAAKGGESPKTNETQSMEDALDVQPTPGDEVDCTETAEIELEDLKISRQNREFWSPSVFSLAGSFMNLPSHSHRSIAAQPSCSNYEYGNDYTVHSMWEDASSS